MTLDAEIVRRRCQEIWWPSPCGFSGDGDGRWRLRSIRPP